MKTLIFVTTQFIALHRWADAKDFLKEFHRHLFKVKVTISVENSDREIEFFKLQRQVNDYVCANYNGRELEKSCELMAEEIFLLLSSIYPDRMYRVEVSEDGENGSIVTS